MSKAQIVDLKTLPPVTWEDTRVMTTELLAKVYGADAKRIQNNYARNIGRFIEGKHFYRVAGQALKDLRLSLSDSQNLQPSLRGSQIPAKARSMILWTERGAMRHAKMLETDNAWEVFETLEDCYFAIREKVKAESTLSTVMDRYPLYGFTIDTVLRHRILFSKVYLFLNLFAGSKRFKDMTKEQASEVIEFADRFAIGQDTGNDWRRIQENQIKLHGEPIQPDWVNRLLTL